MEILLDKSFLGHKLQAKNIVWNILFQVLYSA